MAQGKQQPKFERNPCIRFSSHSQAELKIHLVILVWWIATFAQNLALICLTVSEKTRFTDDGRTDDGRLRHGISSADTVKQS